nr:MbeB family mobilization protein [Klebsiella pneumoniae subsp. pneumoniae]
MSKILDMAKDFEQSSKQQANAIEKRLTEEFTRHESYLRGVEIKRGENERRYCRAQPENGLAVAQNVDLDAGQHRPVLERNERDPLVSGELIAERQATLQALAEKGAKADPVREEIGAPLRADLRPQSNRLGEGYLWIVPKGTK